MQGGGNVVGQLAQSCTASLARFICQLPRAAREMGKYEQPCSQELYSASATQSTAVVHPYWYFSASARSSEPYICRPVAQSITGLGTHVGQHSPGCVCSW